MNGLGSLVRTYRKKSGMSQIELARLADVGKTAVFDIEKGKATVRLDTLLRVLDALNIRAELHGPFGDVVVISAREDSEEAGDHAKG